MSRTAQLVLLIPFDYLMFELPWVQFPSAASLGPWQSCTIPAGGMHTIPSCSPRQLVLDLSAFSSVVLEGNLDI